MATATTSPNDKATPRAPNSPQNLLARSVPPEITTITKVPKNSQIYARQSTNGFTNDEIFTPKLEHFYESRTSIRLKISQESSLVRDFGKFFRLCAKTYSGVFSGPLFR